MRRSNFACDSSAVCLSNIFSKGLLPAGGQSARSRLTDLRRPRQLQTAQPVFASAVDYDAETHMDAWDGRITDDWPALVLSPAENLLFMRFRDKPQTGKSRLLCGSLLRTAETRYDS